MAVVWRVWVPGVVTPVACLLIDYAAGEPILQLAPAALLALASMGIASLALERNARSGSRVALAVVGPLWVAAGGALLLALPLAALSGFGLLVVAGAAGAGDASAVGFLAWALLGLTPLWTAVAYLREAWAVRTDLASRHGGTKTWGLATAGALAAIAVIAGAHVSDQRFVDARIAVLESGTPTAWAVALQELGSYPLCGRYRCRRRVCSRILVQFPPPPDASAIGPVPPAPISAAFKRAFGVQPWDACGIAAL